MIDIKYGVNRISFAVSQDPWRSMLTKGSCVEIMLAAVRYTSDPQISEASCKKGLSVTHLMVLLAYPIMTPLLQAWVQSLHFLPFCNPTLFSGWVSDYTGVISMTASRSREDHGESWGRIFCGDPKMTCITAAHCTGRTSVLWLLVTTGNIVHVPKRQRNCILWTGSWFLPEGWHVSSLTAQVLRLKRLLPAE